MSGELRITRYFDRICSILFLSFMKYGCTKTIFLLVITSAMCSDKTFVVNFIKM